MTFRVRWTGGGEAALVSLSGDAIVLRSTVPSPPGSRIEGRAEGGYPASLRVKVHACRRQDSGGFLLEARVLDLTREDRQRLEAAAANAVPAEAPRRE